MQERSCLVHFLRLLAVWWSGAQVHNVILLAVSAERRLCSNRSISCRPSPQQQTRHMLLQRSIDGTDTVPLRKLPHAMRAVSVTVTCSLILVEDFTGRNETRVMVSRRPKDRPSGWNRRLPAVLQLLLQPGRCQEPAVVQEENLAEPNIVAGSVANITSRCSIALFRTRNSS